MKYLYLGLLIIVLGAGLFFALNKGNSTKIEELKPLQYKDLVYVETPLVGAKISSPLVLSGRARGFWYFEASFPVELLDGNGNQIFISPVQAQGEWMTTEYVPFSTILTFSKPATATGTLILHKDNPSGLPENDDFVSIPVTF